MLLAAPIAGFARKKSTPLPTPPTSINREYVSALSVANRFLQAWQGGDQEAALLLLSDAAKHQVSQEQLERMLSSSDSAFRAYQISRGKKLGATRYAFPVTLIDAGQQRTLPHVHGSRIIVNLAGKEWAVDRLP
jgi:hypothetical protein